MPAAQEACLDQLKLLLRQKCEDFHVVPRLVADKEELEAIVRGKLEFAKSHIAHDTLERLATVLGCWTMSGTQSVVFFCNPEVDP